MLVVAYMRYSSENQRDGYSIEAQQKAIREYCERKGWELVHEYIDEARSGTNDDREAFQQMISDASKNNFEGVVVHKFDRFSRDKYDNAIYKRELRNYGIRVYSVLEELDDSPESLILETLLEGMAEYYSRNLAREVKKGFTIKASKGGWCGGTPPYGYRANSDGKLEIIPDQAEIVKYIFDFYANGRAIQEISIWLNFKGYKTKKGLDFAPATVRGILRNEKYVGTFIYRKTKVVKTKTGKHNVPQKPSDVIVVDNAIPRIIDDEIWNKVQNRLRANTYSSTKAKVDYLLTGLIFCGDCGCKYVGGGSVPRYDKNGNEVSRYNYYICSRRRVTHDCRGAQISKERIEQACINAIIKYCYNKESIELFADDFQKWIKENDRETNAEINAYKAELKKLEQQKARLVTLALDGVLSPIETKEQKNLIERKMALIEPKIQAAQTTNYPSKKELIEFMQDRRKRILDGTFDDYKTLLQEHIESVVAYEDYQVITLAKVPYLVNPPQGKVENKHYCNSISDNATFPL